MLAHTVSFYLRFSVFAGKVWLNASLKRETFKEKFPKLVSYLGYTWSFARFYLLLPMAIVYRFKSFLKANCTLAFFWGLWIVNRRYLICGFGMSSKHLSFIFTWFSVVKIFRPKLPESCRIARTFCGNASRPNIAETVFPQNFHMRKLGEITVSYAMQIKVQIRFLSCE